MLLSRVLLDYKCTGLPRVHHHTLLYNLYHNNIWKSWTNSAARIILTCIIVFPSIVESWFLKTLNFLNLLQLEPNVISFQFPSLSSNWDSTLCQLDCFPIYWYKQKRKQVCRVRTGKQILRQFCEIKNTDYRDWIHVLSQIFSVNKVSFMRYIVEL